MAVNLLRLRRLSAIEQSARMQINHSDLTCFNILDKTVLYIVFIYSSGDNKFDIQIVFKHDHQAGNVNPSQPHRHLFTTFHELTTSMNGSQTLAHKNLTSGVYNAGLEILRRAKKRIIQDLRSL